MGAGAVQGDKKIRLLDDGDPATFNAVLSDGACVGDGHTTLDEFIAELAATQDAHSAYERIVGHNQGPSRS